MDDIARINAEWVTLNAVRGMTKLAAKGDLGKSTYDGALRLGGELYPELLGSGVSLLRSERESDTAKEFRQRARLRSIKEDVVIDPLDLIREVISEETALLEIEKQNKKNRGSVDQIKRRLAALIGAEKELNPSAHSENQLIFRDALSVERVVPVIGSGRAYRDFELPDSNILRVRVLHPDKPEHITGADIIYERHSPGEETANIVAVQYKVWEKKMMYLTDPRMLSQLTKLRKFTCEGQVCDSLADSKLYRFPCCASFLRPTDKLQKADQAFISSGQHLPICKIDECKSVSERGSPILEYKNMRGISLSSEMFEGLFNSGKIGSRELGYEELRKLYEVYEVESEKNAVVIYAQEFADNPEH
jgi:hypothetical protein